MQSKAKLALARFAKVLLAGAVASTIGWLASPAFADVVGTQYAVLIAATLTPVLSGLEKGWLKATS